MNNLPTKIDAVEAALVAGDLSKLTPEQRVNYYNRSCESLGLNPLTKPFDYLTLNGKLVLYANRGASDQLRKLNGVSVQKLEKRSENGLYIVDAYAADKTGRTDVSTAAVAISGLSGEKLCNAIMKTETKAKRRVTLSICGLGWLDETEVDSIQGAERVAAATMEERKEEPAPAELPAPEAQDEELVYVYDLKGVDVHRLAAAEDLLRSANAYQNDLGQWVSPKEVPALHKRLVLLDRQEVLV